MKKKNLLQRIPASFLDKWPYIVLAAISTIFAIFLLTYKLGGLVPGMSQPEAQQQSQLADQTIGIQQVVIDNPMHLPFDALLYILQLFNISNPLAIRGISVLFGLISIAAVFLILHRWHTLRIAIFTTLLYATSAGFLHVARHGDALSTYLLVPVILAAALYVRSINSEILRGILLLIAGILSLYIPGMFWLLLLLAVLYHKTIIVHLKQFRTVTGSVYGTIAAAFMALLGFSFILNPTALLRWLGVAQEGLPTVQEYGMQVLSIPIELFARGPDNLTLWVGSAGIIDIFSTVLFLLGSYYYFVRRKLDRTKILFGSMLILVLAAGLGGPVPTYALLPFIYIVAAAGMSLLLQQWFTVFPRNPFARGFAITLLVICISATVVYNTHRYFVAWPRTPAVQAEFQHQAE